MKWEDAGLYNEFKTKKYRSVRKDPGINENKHYYKDLLFINSHNMNQQQRLFGANNIIHWFSKKMKFPEFIGGLPEDKRNSFSIGPKHIEDFMLSSYNMPQSKMRRVYHLDIPVYFCIKHKNQGKIESYKWFFKGFCDYMQPEFCQMVDVGSIPLQGSISSVIMHMEAFPNVGGACGEIEWMLNDLKEDGDRKSVV